MYRSEVAICKHAQPGIAGQSFSEFSAIRDLRFELNRQEEVEAELASQLAEALKLHTTVAQGSAADMLAVAEAVLKEAAESTQKRRTALALRDSQMTEITRLEAKLVEAGESVLNWRQSWEAALHDAGLPSGASPAAVEAYLTSVREIAAGLATANDLRDRIAKMQADAGVFGETVGELVERLNPALRSMEPETAIAQLHQALLEANENRKLLRQEIKRQGEVEPKLRQAEQTASRCAAELDEVYREAIAPDGPSAREARARSNRRRELERVLSECDGRLGLVSAGKTIDEFLGEAAAGRLDQIQQETLSVKREREEIEERRRNLDAEALADTAAWVPLRNLGMRSGSVEAHADHAERPVQMASIPW